MSGNSSDWTAGSPQAIPSWWLDLREYAWPHDIEVALVKRGYFCELQAFRDGDRGGIDDAERKIDVGLDQPGHALDILVIYFSDVEAVAAERLQESDLGLRSDSGLKQVSDFSQYRRRHQQRSLSLAQQLQAGMMGVIFDVTRGQQDSGVAQQHVSGRVRR
jgi:hypothetical protein